MRTPRSKNRLFRLWGAGAHKEGMPKRPIGKRSLGPSGGREETCIEPYCQLKPVLVLETLVQEPESSHIRGGIPRSDLGVYVNGRLNDYPVEILLDSGSSISILAKSFYYSMDPRFRPKIYPPIDSQFLTANGTVGKIEGQFRVNLIVELKEVETTFVIADIADNVILGMPALTALQCNVDFSGHVVTCEGTNIPCYDHYRNVLSRKVTAKGMVVIPASSEKYVPIRVSKEGLTGPSPLLVEPSGKFVRKYCALPARCLVDPNNDDSVLRVCNPMNQSLVIHDGTALGIASQVSEVYPQSGGNSAHTVRNVRTTDHEADLPDHLTELYHRVGENLGGPDLLLVKGMLMKYQHVFSKGEGDIGYTTVVEHKIDTGDAKPQKQPPRRLPQTQRDELGRQVKGLLEQDFIEPCHGDWASGVCMVKKKDGSLRATIDLRYVNSKTLVKDAYSLPSCQEILSLLGGQKWFSNLDLCSGYWQVGLHPDSRPKTGFATHVGYFQWKRMCFGLTNAGQTFQRLMDAVLGSMAHMRVLAYLDDIIVPSVTVSQMVERLSEVFERLAGAGLKLKAKKCSLFVKKCTFLGHIVSEQGVETDPEKIEAVQNWPTPTDKTAVRAFVGLGSYYRKYVPGFAKICRPLHRLAEIHSEFVWSEECEESFVKLKGLLTQAPVLAHPLPDDPFLLDTDASNFAIGAVLSQIQNGCEKVIAYSSKALNRPETNYCVTRKELWSVVYNVQHFRQYLYGRHFTIRVDHASLQWLHRFKEPNGQLSRWLAILGEYTFTMVLRPGASHRNADSLSRIPCAGKVCLCEELSGLAQETVGTQTEPGPVRVMAIRQGENVGSVGVSNEPLDEGEQFWTDDELRQAQGDDKDIGTVLESKIEGVKPKWEEISTLSQRL